MAEVKLAPPGFDRDGLGKVAVTCMGGLAVALWTESFWIGAAAYYGLLLLATASALKTQKRPPLARRAPDPA
ncbi:hypothetical protein BH09PSE2_BH09PSE2_25140 [soil metagenome]